eukprot:403362074
MNLVNVSIQQNCFDQRQMPLFFGDAIDDFTITAIAQDAEEIVFGGAAGTDPLVGCYHQQNNFHIVKWINSYETQGQATVVKSILFRNQVVFANLIGAVEIYLILNPVNGEILYQNSYSKA